VVLVERIVEGLVHGLDDVRGRTPVGVPDAQVDDVDSAPQLLIAGGEDLGQGVDAQIP
jgi:hypothetical protein